MTIEDMNTIKFSIEPSRFRERAMFLSYRPTAKAEEYELVSVEWSETCSAKMKQNWLAEIPTIIHYRYCENVAEFAHWKVVGCEINMISHINTSFETFWNSYAYKVGNKSRVQKKWNAIKESERILAIGAIPRYKRFAESKRIERVYPETYIDQRRWENEF